MADRANTQQRRPKQAAPLRPPAPDTETLNFKVSSEFKREYKGYAVSRGITMVELLQQSYQQYREKHGG